MGNLYELTKQWEEIFELLLDPEMDEQSVLDSCESIEADMSEIAENYGKVIRMLELEAGNCKTESSRLLARAKTAETRAAALKQRLYDAMKTTGQAKLRTPLFTYSIQKSPPAVKITDLELAWISGYVKPQEMNESNLDKAAMKRDMLLGNEVPGAELVQGESLRMR